MFLLAQFHFSAVAVIAVVEKDVLERRAIRPAHHRQGNFMGIATTGRKNNVRTIIIYRIANNKIIEYWMQFDSLALMQQLGVQPGPEQLQKYVGDKPMLT